MHTVRATTKERDMQHGAPVHPGRCTHTSEHARAVHAQMGRGQLQLYLAAPVSQMWDSDTEQTQIQSFRYVHSETQISDTEPQIPSLSRAAWLARA